MCTATRFIFRRGVACARNIDMLICWKCIHVYIHYRVTHECMYVDTIISCGVHTLMSFHTLIMRSWYILLPVQGVLSHECMYMDTCIYIILCGAHCFISFHILIMYPYILLLEQGILRHWCMYMYACIYIISCGVDTFMSI